MGIDSDTPSREAIEYLSEALKRVDGKTKPVEPCHSLDCSSPATSSSSSSHSRATRALAVDDALITNWPPTSPDSPRLGDDWLDVFQSPTIDWFSSPLETTGLGLSALLQKEVGLLRAPPTPLGFASSALDSMSQDVLRYYIQYTSELLMSKKSGADNIWKSTVLQLAESDELVMNGVLAVGSVHLSASMPQNQAVEEITAGYLLKSITGLRRALKAWVSSDKSADDTLRLMLVTSLLAEHECLSGNHHGSLQFHLRASYPVAKVLESQQRAIGEELVTNLLESMAYMQSISCLRFPTPGESGASDLLRMIQEGRLALLKSSNRFGNYFGCTVELYEMVPALHKFYATRELEIRTGRDLGCDTKFTDLLRDISSWQPQKGHYRSIGAKHTDEWYNENGGFVGRQHRNAQGTEGAEDNVDTNEQAMIASGLATQNVLVLFLYSAYLRHPEDHDRLKTAVQPIVDDALEQLDRVRGTTWENTTWWATVVVGAYAQARNQRRRVERSILACAPPLLLAARGLELLRALWDGPDDLFGFEGLSSLAGPAGGLCFA
ncbi:fungal-specific transcription factor domain-containing protein [Dactylonectria macrodidyma]|uniref:Fungal-specific transcription factor domain-containing protein n=1 Tax=Dactylonectria macrodidyma TaxID=307937 RepID=A0A9P9JPF3_9HYPO|nr:fungal-specific transcription factor domain-containing protein [Dactylonectria macrodidyma]